MKKKLIGLLAATGLQILLTACSTTPPVYDLLIVDGTIVDGSGAPAYAGDLAIVGDEIVKIGDLNGATAIRVIDASGLTVSPG
jgi:N-acyl-D-aspartate/D-glutamate deacylase